jgi:cytochrome oxidase Cu insertion factor (SCO1/SenC/PrrC family)
VRLVSITVDPAHDTPAVLSAYASRLQAHPGRWLFLTGDKKHIYRLAQQGFHLGVYDVRDAGQTSQRQPEVPLRRVVAGLQRVFEPAVAMAHHGPHGTQGTQENVTQAIQHSDRLVLVDRQGRIRQYYDSKDKDAFQRLERDVTRVLAES